MIAAVWTTATDVASGALAIVVLALIRSVLLLRDRVARLEALLEDHRAEVFIARFENEERG